MTKQIQYNSDHVAIFDGNKLLFKFTTDEMKTLSKLLPIYPTQELVDELSNREGVTLMISHKGFFIDCWRDTAPNEVVQGEGAAHILVVKKE